MIQQMRVVKEIIQGCLDDAPLLFMIHFRIEKAVRHQVREFAMRCILNMLGEALLNDADSAVVDVMNFGIQFLSELLPDV